MKKTFGCRTCKKMNGISRKGHSRGYACLAVLLLLIIAFPARSIAKEGIYPVWIKGDAWSVSAVYPARDGGWSKSVLWEYCVINVPGVEFNGYVLAVKSLGRAPEVSARLVYSVDFSLTEVNITRMFRGKKTMTTRKYESGAPVLTRRSPMPFDTPLFPLTSPSTNDYRATRKMAGGLSFAISVTQRVASDVEDNGMVEIVCEFSDGERFLQRWQSDRPWSVYGENSNMKYHLVEK